MSLVQWKAATVVCVIALISVLVHDKLFSPGDAYLKSCPPAVKIFVPVKRHAHAAPGELVSSRTVLHGISSCS